jgi:hypothetical protein
VTCKDSVVAVQCELPTTQCHTDTRACAFASLSVSLSLSLCVRACREALRECNGDFDAALGYLATLGDEEEKHVIFAGDKAAGSNGGVSEQGEGGGEGGVKKLTGKKAKEARKAAAAEKAKAAGGGGSGSGGGDSHLCNVCKAEFPSRSKLFTHIKGASPSHPAPALLFPFQTPESQGGVLL